MDRFKRLMKIIVVFGLMSLSCELLASSTQKVPLSFKWGEPTHQSKQRQNCSLKNLQACTLRLSAGNTVPVLLTITNNSTRTTAVNIRAILPPALADIVQNASDCAQLLPLQQCQIAFTPSNTVHPATTVSVRGDNTMSYDIIIEVIPSSFTVGGTITGLTAQGLVLKNNGVDNLSVPISSTSFQFLTPIMAGFGYNVTVFTQPSGLFCTVTNGVGNNITSNVTNVILTCIPNSRFLYAANFNNNTISLCSINQSNGLLFDCGQVITVGLISPVDIVINPARTLAYIVNLSSTIFLGKSTINPSTGGLGTPSVVAIFNQPTSVAFNLAGSRAYITQQNQPAVITCSVIAGNFSSCNLTGPALPSSTSVTINKAGTFAYIAVGNTGTVYVCGINPSGTIQSTCVATSGFGSPTGVTLNPAGNFLYVADDSYKNVSICAVNSSNGTLSNCSFAAPAPGPSSLFSGRGKIAFNNSGTRAYVPFALGLDNFVYVCTVDQTTGAFLTCVDSQAVVFNGPAGLATY